MSMAWFSLSTHFQGSIRHTPVFFFYFLLFYLHMMKSYRKNAFVWPQSTSPSPTFYSSRVKEVDTQKKGLFCVLVVGRWQESYACFNSLGLLLDSWQECVWSIFYFLSRGGSVQVLMSLGFGFFFWRLDKHAQGTVTAGIIFRPPLSLALGGRHYFPRNSF